MTDIHAHILPGLDDGAQDMGTAIAMAELAESGGVTAIVATPHSNLDRGFPNYWDEGLRHSLSAFRQALREAGTAVTVYDGMEIFGTPDVPKKLEEGKLITLGGSRYPLIEFPFQGYARQAAQVLKDLVDMGYRPVVAHPERYAYVQEHPEMLNGWLDMGCLLQVNKGSLFGRFGRRAELLSLSLLDRGFAAFVASDAHSSVVRTTWMADIRQFLSEEYSEELARLLTEENPRSLLENEDIRIAEPEWF